jgi:transposase
MKNSVSKIDRPVRRRLKKLVQRGRDRDHARRAQAILALWETGGNLSEAARRCHASRNSVKLWKSRFEADGETGLTPLGRGRTQWKATAEVLVELNDLVRTDPTTLGYLRSRWSSELLAVELSRGGVVEVHATTVRRWLSGLSIVWRRARPTLCIADPRKSERMRAIRRVLRRASASDEVFYVDEADIDLNPRIGPAWMPKGEQMTVPTPGKNRKHYLAGALNARTGAVVWTEYTAKTSELFLRLMEKLMKTYRRARRLILIVDNYIIHKSRVTQGWLAHHPKIQLLFQPAYHPWVNNIEKLWKKLHDTVTRNHRHTTLLSLMRAVTCFMNESQPFPGHHSALIRHQR